MVHPILEELGIPELSPGAHDGTGAIETSGERIEAIDPTTGKVLAQVSAADDAACERIVAGAQRAFERWREMPAPKRGDVVREIGMVLRENKTRLGRLVSLEAGKIRSEGEGEVQEMIDVADFAVGLSRQLYGKTMHSERPSHRMYEQWHPLGPVGVITAFNFPVAVWSWNALIAAVCGDTVVWKPSELTPLCAVAVQRLIEPVVKRHGLEGVFNLVIGRGATVGERLIRDPRLPLISATGSCAMGRHVGQVVAGRFGRTLLELGGNNAIIVLDDADIDLALHAVSFGAVGTAGQRCTTTRRLLLQEGIHDRFVERLASAYRGVRVGDPMDDSTLMGPLIRAQAVDAMLKAVARAKAEGGKVLAGGGRVEGQGYFVEPTIIQAHAGMTIWKEETFAPILYVFKVRDHAEALRLHNAVEQGLSSAIFTTDLRRAEAFLSAAGSDCGIANVNIGTSGAEIGGAFGGEKATGGGRESGSDSWKAYMRRQTNTINWGRELPLAQGVRFNLF